jgi:hypothetical protein
MTTCTSALQSDQWASGSYIDWSKVDAFLEGVYQGLLTNLGPSFPQRVLTAPLSFGAVGAANNIVTILEMMYGQDLYAATLPSTSNFDGPKIRNLLGWLIEGQKGSAPGADNTPSGDFGWWGNDGPSSDVLNPDHHILLSSLIYMTLRRNTSGLNALGYAPAGLEHKLLPIGVNVVGGPGAGGGLTDFEAWVQEIYFSCGIPDTGTPGTASLVNGTRYCDCQTSNGLACNPTGPYLNRAKDYNFWGELVGMVPLYQSMYDEVNNVSAEVTSSGLPYQPSLTELSPTQQWCGATIENAFVTWRERFYTPAGGSPAGSSFVAAAPQPPLNPATVATRWSGSPAYCNWVSPPGSDYQPVTTPTQGLVNALLGQDWDCGLHELVRAVQSAHHLGHSFTPYEKLLIMYRLLGWWQQTCGAYTGYLQTCATSPAVANAMVPNERFAWEENTLALGGNTIPCENVAGTPQRGPSDAPAVTLSDIASVAALLVQADLFSDPTVGYEAYIIAEGLVQVVASLYREPGSSLAGWAEFDERPSLDHAPDLRGTMAAVLTLMVLAGTGLPPASTGNPSPGFQAAYRPTALPSAIASSGGGLSSFLHLFGGKASANTFPGQWGGGYVPG